MQKEEKIPKNVSSEKLPFVNEILRECIKLELFESEEEMDNLFDELSSLDLNQLNQILDEKLYKNGIDAFLKK